MVWATAYASTDMESTTTEGASVAEGLPKANRRKNDRDRSTLLTGNGSRVYRFLVVDSRQNLDANQSNHSYIRLCMRIP